MPRSAPLGPSGRGEDRRLSAAGGGLTGDEAPPADERTAEGEEGFPDTLRAGEPDEGFEHHTEAKKTADVYLTRTGLDRLTARPGTLLDEPGTGRVSATPHAPALSRVIVELTRGETP
ncbi:hypothetical protein ABT150_25895 [Streptomyces mirabilis]|uniref:hypothetical protein n=1 Tax=Streptomyces mirabilis TaxID=68239 RepID=UPI003330C23A